MQYVTYCRVSTQKQGMSGLGLDAQRSAVMAHVKDGEVVGEFVEVESGRKNNRPKLIAALALAKKHKATLVIAKLDRLARNVHFISGLMESKVDFIACDMPHATPLSIHIFAAMAEYEAKAISARTTAALKTAKERGTKIGGDRGKLETARAVNCALADERAAEVIGRIKKIQKAGATSLREIARELNYWGMKTDRGCEWTAAGVSRVIARAA